MQSVLSSELSYYLTKTQPYGIPLDDRALFTKTDWESWVAAMGTPQQFSSIFSLIFKFAQETPDRVPFTDWYDTNTGRLHGFRARPVMGGLFARAMVQAMVV
jgi:hypothetical protein